eukprot:scaffold80684_cov17-Tisochrysis_lutea.AAC.1
MAEDAAGSARGEAVYLAKLAEQAERYDEMVEEMKKGGRGKGVPPASPRARPTTFPLLVNARTGGAHGARPGAVRGGAQPAVRGLQKRYWCKARVLAHYLQHRAEGGEQRQRGACAANQDLPQDGVCGKRGGRGQVWTRGCFGGEQ